MQDHTHTRARTKTHQHSRLVRHMHTASCVLSDEMVQSGSSDRMEKWLSIRTIIIIVFYRSPEKQLIIIINIILFWHIYEPLQLSSGTARGTKDSSGHKFLFRVKDVNRRAQQVQLTLVCSSLVGVACPFFLHTKWTFVTNLRRKWNSGLFFYYFFLLKQTLLKPDASYDTLNKLQSQLSVGGASEAEAWRTYRIDPRANYKTV